MSSICTWMPCKLCGSRILTIITALLSSTMQPLGHAEEHHRLNAKHKWRNECLIYSNHCCDHFKSIDSLRTMLLQETKHPTIMMSLTCEIPTRKSDVLAYISPSCFGSQFGRITPLSKSPRRRRYKWNSSITAIRWNLLRHWRRDKDSIRVRTGIVLWDHTEVLKMERLVPTVSLNATQVSSTSVQREISGVAAWVGEGRLCRLWSTDFNTITLSP